jgi:hypothetical protein
LNNTTSYITISSTGSSAAYHFAIAAPNGKVFCFQWEQTTGMLVINSNNDTASIVSTLNFRYDIAGVFSPVNERIYVIPGYAGGSHPIRVINPNDNTLTTVSEFTTTSAYFSAVIATNNSIYATSSLQATNPLIRIQFNPNVDDGKIVKTTQYYGSGTTALLPSQITSTPTSTASNLLIYCGVYG